jgi:serine/threonine-protein kinase RsbT
MSPRRWISKKGWHSWGLPENSLNMAAQERYIPIRSDLDIVEARLAVRSIAEEAGFAGTDLVLIATAVSEVARNIVEYAKEGEVVISLVQNGSRRGVLVIASDAGPGIADVNQALQEGYTTSRGLGLGLPGSRRLMDEFEISSNLGKGTAVKMKKWVK